MRGQAVPANAGRPVRARFAEGWAVIDSDENNAWPAEFEGCPMRPHKPGHSLLQSHAPIRPSNLWAR